MKTLDEEKEKYIIKDDFENAKKIKEEQEKLKVILANCQYDSNIACGKQKISCTINCINHPSHFAEEFARYEYKHKYERFLKANGLKDGAYARNLFDEVYDDI